MSSTTARKKRASSTGFREIASRATDDDGLRLSAREPERRFETKRLAGTVTILVVVIGIPAVVIAALIAFSTLVQTLPQ